MTPPKKESACYKFGKWRRCSADSSRRRTFGLCSLCFPDDEIPDYVTHLLFGQDGKTLHRSVEQGGSTDRIETSERSEYSDVTHILQREDVTTIEDARRAAGGDA
jgi:hypothetical protein